MSKIKKNERISTLEDAVAMNWSDMKKIETKISRAMTDMATRISNISLQLEGQQRQIHLAADSIGLNKQAIIMLENKAEPEPQLKQLDQSVFDGADPKYITAATNEDGRAFLFPVPKRELEHALGCWFSDYRGDSPRVDGLFDASNWQNSLIERDTAKEPLEVDLSSELTGSELCRAMINRGDKIVLCIVKDYEHENDIYYDAITHCSNDYFESTLSFWRYAVPINNQGEPLTASEVGL